jgi:hypothetical protein
VAGGRAANTGIAFVLPRVSHHLRGGTAPTEHGHTQIFAPGAVLFRDLVPGPDVLSGTAECIHSPTRKNHIPGKAQDRDKYRPIAVQVGNGSDFERGRIQKESGHKKNDDEEALPGPIERAGITEPRELHSTHNLRHANLCAAKRTAEGRVTDAQLEAIKQTILPLSSGGQQTWSVVVLGERRQKDLTFFHPSFGLGNKRRKRKQW